MKAQASIEFLLSFLATVTCLLLLLAAVLNAKAQLDGKAAQLSKVAKVESAARATEAWLNSGLDMEFSFSQENISYRIQNSKFQVLYGDKVIEVGGLFGR